MQDTNIADLFTLRKTAIILLMLFVLSYDRSRAVLNINCFGDWNSFEIWKPYLYKEALCCWTHRTVNPALIRIYILYIHMQYMRARRSIIAYSNVSSLLYEIIRKTNRSIQCCSCATFTDLAVWQQ